MRSTPLAKLRSFRLSSTVLPAILSILMLTSLVAAAHEDMGAGLESFEKTYTASDPIGRIRITYSARNTDKPTLALECRLFKASVPAAGLTDLPGPGWDALGVFYSTTTTPMIVGGRKLEPYVYISVPLRGPRGTAWNQTWVTFHFDANGLTRKIKHFAEDNASNSTYVSWADWPIGSGITAEQALRQPRQ